MARLQKTLLLLSRARCLAGRPVTACAPKNPRPMRLSVGVGLRRSPDLRPPKEPEGGLAEWGSGVARVLRVVGMLAVGQNRLGMPFWGRCTTHFRLYFSGDGDVHWGSRVLTHCHSGPIFAPRFGAFGARDSGLPPGGSTNSESLICRGP